MIKPNLERLEYALSHSDFRAAKLNCQVSVIDVHKYTKEKDDVYDMINFMADMLFDDQCIIHYVDEETVKKKERKDKIDQLLNDALENGGFEMYYQPIYWSKERKIKSVIFF